MEKVIAFVLLFLCGIAWSSPTSSGWHGLSLPDWSTGLHLNPNGGRDLINGQWLGGYGIDALYYQIPGSFQGKPLPKLYLSVDHEWNAADLLSTPKKAQGLWGPSLGTSIGGLATKAQALVNLLPYAIDAVAGTNAPKLNLPPWLVTDLDKWVTIESGAGNRIFGNLNGVKPWGAWIGGRVTVQFDVNAHH